MTPLAYSIPGFRETALADVSRPLDGLRALDFRWVTLTPTYLVIDNAPMRIDLSRSPRHENIAEAVEYARSLGMSVRLEPHLDWESTLTGGEYQWRRRMHFDPSAAYFSQVIEPSLSLPIQELTLGSELDAAWLGFGSEWRDVLDKVRAAAIRAGHKLNHDALESGVELTKLVNGERARLGLAPWDHENYEGARIDANLYLSQLDYVSFSFYPAVEGEDYVDSFQRAARKVDAGLRAAAGFQPEMAIGEFGLGSDDATKPWHFDKQTFLDAEGLMKQDARERRQSFYLAFLSWMQAQDLLGASPACFWTVDQYDFLGCLGSRDEAIFRDEVLRSAVHRYNRAAAGTA